jgi:hypothetical protein
LSAKLTFFTSWAEAEIARVVKIDRIRKGDFMLPHFGRWTVSASGFARWAPTGCLFCFIGFE